MRELYATEINATLTNIAESLSRANKALEDYTEDWALQSANFHLQLAYLKLLILTEAMNLPLLRAKILHDFEQAKEEDMVAIDTDFQNRPFWKWALPVRRYVSSLRALFVAEAPRVVTRDLRSILKATNYAIHDSKVYKGQLDEEKVLHWRVENVLRCVYPDLIHKPTLSKPVKSFEPDTGIPSLQTLIEYKFLDSEEKVKQVADELLADTRGYMSEEWTSVIFAVYETKRYRSEEQWNQLFEKAGVDPARMQVIVISGETPDPKKNSPEAA